MSDPTEKCLRNILSLLGHPQGAGSCRPTFLAERRSRRQEIFSPVHLVLIVEHTPQTDKELPAVAGPRLFVSVHPSLFDLSVILPSHLLACTHAHKPKPPRQEVQAWIPAGVPNSNQSGGTARGGRSHSSPPSFIPALSLSPSSCYFFFFFLPLGFSHLPPHVLATRAHMDTPRLHTKTHPPPPRDFGQLTRVLCDVLQTQKVCV